MKFFNWIYDSRSYVLNIGLRAFYAFTICFFSFNLLITSVFAKDSTDVKSNPGVIENILTQGLSFMNQLKYSNDYQQKLNIFEDWLNLDYRTESFSAGFRLVSFQPKDPTVGGIRREYTEIDFKYVKLDFGDEIEGISLTLGNYYAMFGRGLILKSYENRNIRIDNNLLGGKLICKYHGLSLSVLSGLPENLNGVRKDILFAADLEYDLFSLLRTGITFAINRPDIQETSVTRVLSTRIEPKIWNIDLYFEYALRQNADEKRRYFSPEELFTGRAIYGSANFYYGSISLFSEYKYYDNFSFCTFDNSVNYNTPPAGRKDYTLTLLSRHPSPLNQNNEKGYQFEINYYFSNDIFLTANYGETKSLPSGSYNQKINNSISTENMQLKELMLLSSINWNEYFSMTAGIAYNEELASNTKNITPVIELRYYFGSLNTLRFTMEHQQTKNRSTQEKYYTDLMTLEYSRSPGFSLSFVTEMSTREPEADKIVRAFWNYIQLGYNLFNNTDLMLTIGSRQAGAICIGGVCRYEPEFHGIELKLLTRF